MSHVLIFQLTAYFDKTLSRVAQATEVESVIADLQVGGVGNVVVVNVQTSTLQIHYSI